MYMKGQRLQYGVDRMEDGGWRNVVLANGKMRPRAEMESFISFILDKQPRGDPLPKVMGEGS